MSVVASSLSGKANLALSRLSFDGARVSWAMTTSPRIGCRGVSLVQDNAASAAVAMRVTQRLNRATISVSLLKEFPTRARDSTRPRASQRQEAYPHRGAVILRAGDGVRLQPPLRADDSYPHLGRSFFVAATDNL